MRAKKTYQQKKEEARQKAVDWQLTDGAIFCYSYEGILILQEHFGKLARRYGLVKEFAGNGIPV